ELAPGFETWVVDSKESDIYMGVLQTQNPDSITLRQENGRSVVIPRNNIDVLQQQAWSLMPDGLEEGMSTQRMADLIEFIMSGPWSTQKPNVIQ
ncbi:MAG TPA: hypothetical protein VHH88_02260, partial [Verrucomicrobiae bacterium]|nr:hypothetical protein [Verrucomicrobiae bacterium]